MIKAVIFDIGGVIVNFSHSTYYRYLSEVSGRKPDFVRSVIEPKLLNSLEMDKISLPIFENKIAERLGVNVEEIDWYGFYRKKVKLNYDVIELVQELSKMYPIAYLSNTNRSRYGYTLKILDLEPFKYRFASCYLHMRKPQPKLYRYVLKHMKVKANEAVFIDNQFENVAGARKVGMNAIWFKSRRKLDVQLSRLGL